MDFFLVDSLDVCGLVLEQSRLSHQNVFYYICWSQLSKVENCWSKLRNKYLSRVPRNPGWESLVK